MLQGIVPVAEEPHPSRKGNRAPRQAGCQGKNGVCCRACCESPHRDRCRRSCRNDRRQYPDEAQWCALLSTRRANGHDFSHRSSLGAFRPTVQVSQGELRCNRQGRMTCPPWISTLVSSPVSDQGSSTPRGRRSDAWPTTAGAHAARRRRSRPHLAAGLRRAFLATDRRLLGFLNARVCPEDMCRFGSIPTYLGGLEPPLHGFIRRIRCSRIRHERGAPAAGNLGRNEPPLSSDRGAHDPRRGRGSCPLRC